MMFYDWIEIECVIHLEPQNIPIAITLTLGSKVVLL